LNSIFETREKLIPNGYRGVVGSINALLNTVVLLGGQDRKQASQQVILSNVLDHKAVGGFDKHAIENRETVAEDCVVSRGQIGARSLHGERQEGTRVIEEARGVGRQAKVDLVEGV